LYSDDTIHEKKKKMQYKPVKMNRLINKVGTADNNALFWILLNDEIIF